MTDGTSQGLFIVVAIVIFGIFVVLAYILFEDTLSPAMASMFNTAFEQAEANSNPFTDENYFEYELVNGDTEVKITKYTGYLEGILDVSIPNTIAGLPVTEIANSSFTNIGLTSVKLPNSLVKIHPGGHVVGQSSSGAFAMNNIQSLHIPKNVTEIGGDAFAKNPLTKGVTFSRGEPIQISSYVFWDTGLTTITIPERVVNLDRAIFEDSQQLHNVTIYGERTGSFGGFIFNNTDLVSFRVPEGFTQIGTHSFSENYRMKELYIPQSVTVLGEYIIRLNSAMEKVTLPEHLREQVESNPKIFHISPGYAGNVVLEYY